MLSTLELIKEQERYREVGLCDGSGFVKQTQYGAFVVFSRISLRKLLQEIQKTRPNVETLKDLKTIFFLGPTPTFFGDVRASTSWRREYVEYAENQPLLNDNFILVLPEPVGCDWKEVDYPGLKGVEHIYAQVHWEDFFINLAAETGILVLNAHFRWQGNAGPTARIEAGKLFSLIKEDKVNACVLNLPKDTQTASYLNAHLVHAKSLCLKKRFIVTSCSPLYLDGDATPIGKDGACVFAGVYPTGASEENQLDTFFTAITYMAITL